MAENTDDVKKLFEQLKCNKTVPSLIPIVEPSAKEVDCTTLLSLLLYCDVDKIDPLFFSTISKKVKQLQNTQSTRLNYEEFQKLFDFSNLNLSNLSQQELASFYKTFDKNVNGEINYTEFLEDYKKTPEYTRNTPDKQREILESITNDFKLINPTKLSITLEEFLSIIATQSNS